MAWPSPPAVVCPTCGTVTNNVGAINQPCSHRGCNGGFVSGLNNNTDWETCRYCSGSGLKDSAQCGGCQGTGWGFIRDGRRY